MAIAAEQAEQTVRVHETPHEVHVEITFPAAEQEPQVLLGITRHGVDVRVFRPTGTGALYRPSPDATRT